MATQNEDLSKIIRELGSFQAEYIKLSPADRPVGCVLPPDGPEVPEIPPVDLPEIHKVCAPNFIEFPIVIEPFIPPESCEDGFSFVKGSGKIRSSLGGAVSGAIEVDIKQAVDNFCEYIIEIPPVVIPCHPEGPSFTGSARINVVDLNTSTAQTVDIKLRKDEEATCRWILEGEVDITIPEVPCPDGVSFNTGILRIASTCPIVPVHQEVVQIVRTDNPCEYDIVLPELKIPCYPDGPKVHGDITVKLKDRGVEFSSQKASISPSTTVSCCDFKLDGDIIIPIPCHNGVSFNEDNFQIKAVPVTAADFAPNKKVIIKKHQTSGVDDICTFDIEFPDITIPCFPNGIQYDGAITFRTLDGPIPDSIDLDAARDPSIPCLFHLDPIEIEIPVPSCPGGISFASNIVIKTNAGNVIPYTNDTTGLRRYHNLTLHDNVGSPRDCGATLEGEINLGLPAFATQCTALNIGPNNSIRFTFDPQVTTAPVIGLKTLDDGCGYEFTDVDINLPVLACDAGHAYNIKSNFNVYVGATKLGPNQNTVKLSPAYSDSPHCGLNFEGDIRFPEIASGSFNYTIWSVFGDDGEPYPQGTVASIVYPEGGRCAYRVMDPNGAPVGLSPTNPEAKSIWQSLGCEDEKVFHPFKVIKTKRLKTQGTDPDYENTFVKVVPRSYLFKDTKADSTAKIYGLDTPFSLLPGEKVYLECVFDAVDNNIVFKHAAIAHASVWDSTINEGAPNEIPGVYQQLYKLFRPVEAKDVLNTFYCEDEIAAYVGIDTATEDKLLDEQTTVVTRIAAVNDNRPRQFKAWILIASADDGTVKEDGDMDEVDAIMLKKGDRQYSIDQKLKQHLLLVSKNVDNVPVVLPMPYDGNDAKLTRLNPPVCTVTAVNQDIQISFTKEPQVDIFGETRSFGTDSDDIHIYYTTDGSTPTINTAENVNAYMYEGGIATFPNDITGPITFMAVGAYFRRSESKFVVLS